MLLTGNRHFTGNAQATSRTKHNFIRNDIQAYNPLENGTLLEMTWQSYNPVPWNSSWWI